MSTITPAALPGRNWLVETFFCHFTATLLSSTHRNKQTLQRRAHASRAPTMSNTSEVFHPLCSYGVFSVCCRDLCRGLSFEFHRVLMSLEMLVLFKTKPFLTTTHRRVGVGLDSLGCMDLFSGQRVGELLLPEPRTRCKIPDIVEQPAHFHVESKPTAWR